MQTIELKGTDKKGDNASLAVLLEYLLIQHGYRVHRGTTYDEGLTELERAKILQHLISNKNTPSENKEVGLEVMR